MKSSRVKINGFIDFFLTAGFIVIIFLLYFKVSREWAIYITLVAIIIIIISYIPSVKEFLYRMRFGSLIKELKEFRIIREPHLINKLNIPASHIHRRLFLLSKIWTKKPMIVYVKNYYLFINQDVIDAMVEFIEDMKGDDKKKKELIHLLREKFKLITNDEVNAILSRLREYEMI